MTALLRYEGRSYCFYGDNDYRQYIFYNLHVYIKKSISIDGIYFFLLGNPICFGGKEEKHWFGRPRRVAPTESAKGSRKTPTQCVLWERGGAGHKVNLRGKAAEWTKLAVHRRRVKRHACALDGTSRFEMWISQGSRSVRTRLILLTFPVGKSYATSAVLPFSHKSRALVGTLVRFVGKRRRRP